MPCKTEVTCLMRALRFEVLWVTGTGWEGVDGGCRSGFGSGGGGEGALNEIGRPG